MTRKQSNKKSIKALTSHMERFLSVSKVQCGKEDVEFWRSRSVSERIMGLQQLRIQFYGKKASARLKRVIEIAQQD